MLVLVLMRMLMLMLVLVLIAIVKVAKVVAQLEEFGEVDIGCARGEDVLVQVLCPLLVLVRAPLHFIRRGSLSGAACGL